jgi:hypothetical protein
MHSVAAAVRPRQRVQPRAAVSLPTSAERAVRVANVADEFTWLQRTLSPGWQVEQQALVARGGRSYDVLTVRHAGGASVRDYWFDVTAHLGAIRETLAPVRPAAGFDPASFVPGGCFPVDLPPPDEEPDGMVCDPATGTCRSPDGKACTLPSGDSACALMSGDISALPRVAFHTLGRSALIAIGVYLAGVRKPSRVAAIALCSALTIEVFALGWTASQQAK